MAKVIFFLTFLFDMQKNSNKFHTAELIVGLVLCSNAYRFL